MQQAQGADMKNAGAYNVLQMKGAQTKQLAQTKSAMPEPLLRDMGKPSNLRFYRHFLQGEISDEKLLPYWVLPHLVMDGHWDAADRYFDSFAFPGEKKQGVALEYSLVFLEKKFKYAQRWYMGRGYGTGDIEDYNKLEESFDKLRKMLLGELERLDGYKIKTKWILDEISRRFSD